MKEFKLNLKLFEGGHAVTVYKDGGFSAASASPNSDVAKDADVTLSWTLSDGYELAEIEQVSGSVTINMTTKKFAMPNTDVVLYLKSKANNLYKVTEDCEASVNDSKVVLHKNTTVLQTPNGAPYEVACNGTAITMSAAVQNLIDTGVLVKI